MRLERSRIGSHRQAKMFCGLLRVPTAEERVGQVVVRARVVWIDREGALIVLDGGTDIALCRLSGSEVVERRRMIGLELQSTLIVDDRLVYPAI